MAIAPDQDLGFVTSSATAITVSGTFPAGALILVCVGFATSAGGQTLSQSGSTFTNLFTRENSSTNNLVYWYGYIKNWAGGALSTTFTLSGGAGKDCGARLLSFTGADTSAPLVLSHDAGGFPKSTTMDTGAATGTTNSTDLIVGFFTWANNDIGGTITESGTPSTGWTKTADSTGTGGTTPHGNACFSYQILTSAATNPDAKITFTTPSTGVSYGASVATFKASSGGAVNGTVSAQLSLAATPKPGGVFIGPSAHVLDLAKIIGPQPVFGVVNANLKLSASPTPGGMFVAPSANLLNLAAGAPHVVDGQVSARLALSASETPGGMFLAPAAQLTALALEGAPHVVTGTVGASLSLSATPTAGGMFLGPSPLIQQMAATAPHVVTGSVTARLSLSASPTPGGSFIGPSAQLRQISLAGAPHVVDGQVSALLAVSASPTPGGAFVGPAALLRQIAEIAAQPTTGAVIGAVNARLSLASSLTPGGMFTAPVVAFLALALRSLYVPTQPPTGATVVQAGYPAGPTIVQAGYPTGSTAAQAGFPTGNTIVQSGTPTGSTIVQAGTPTGSTVKD